MRADHLTDSAADARVSDNGGHCSGHVGVGKCLEPDRLLPDRALDDAQVADFAVIGVLRDGDRIPSVDGFIAQTPLEIRAARRAPERLRRACETRIGPAEASDTDPDLFFRVGVQACARGSM